MFGFNDNFVNDVIAKVLQKSDSVVISVGQKAGVAVWFKKHGKFYVFEVQCIEQGMKSLSLRYAHFDYPSESLSICGEAHNQPVCAFNYVKDSRSDTIDGQRLRDSAINYFLSKLLLKSTRENHPSANDI